MRTVLNMKEYLVENNIVLWLSLAAGPVLWAIHLVIAYWLTSLYCYHGFFRFRIFGIYGLGFIIIVFSLLLAFLTAIAAGKAFRIYKKLNTGHLEGGSIHSDPAGRNKFMAASGIWMSSVFGAYILTAILPILFVRPCY